jgi:hypothetical protein
MEKAMSKKVSYAVACLALSGAAWAGKTNYFETTVNLTTREAYGSFVDTRNSADSVQYIGCDVYLAGTTARVGCFARDAATNLLSCSSADPELVKIAASVSDNSYVRFRCDTSTPTPTTLVYLYVSKGSLWLP